MHRAKKQKLDGSGTLTETAKGRNFFPQKNQQEGFFWEQFLMCVKFIVAPPYPLLYQHYYVLHHQTTYVTKKIHSAEEEEENYERKETRLSRPH